MDDKQSDFEQKLTTLEELVARLEQGELPLEEAIAAFQEGMRLARECSERLTAVDAEIKKLIADNDRFRTEPLETPDV